jgi:hypothetical protein
MLSRLWKSSQPQIDGGASQVDSAALAQLTDEIWQDLGCQVSRNTVQQAVMQEAAAFHNSVAANLIHRRIRVKLIEESNK